MEQKPKAPNSKSDETNKLNRQFGERLRQLRTAKGYSQTKFAMMVGRKQGVVSSWELGNSAPDLGTLFTISKALGEPVTHLLPLEETGCRDDTDQRILDLVHQDPRWSDLFNKLSYISDAGWQAVFSVLNAVSVDHSTDAGEKS